MQRTLAMALLLAGTAIPGIAQAQPVGGASATTPVTATVALPRTRYPTGAAPLSPEEFAALPKLATFRA